MQVKEYIFPMLHLLLSSGEADKKHSCNIKMN